VTEWFLMFRGAYCISQEEKASVRQNMMNLLLIEEAKLVLSSNPITVSLLVFLLLFHASFLSVLF
jgi:hypothetical protein